MPWAVSTTRTNGKPRVVWQKYPGKLEDIVERADKPKILPREGTIFEFGAIAGRWPGQQRNANPVSRGGLGEGLEDAAHGRVGAHTILGVEMQAQAERVLLALQRFHGARFRPRRKRHVGPATANALEVKAVHPR